MFAILTLVKTYASHTTGVGTTRSQSNEKIKNSETTPGRIAVIIHAAVVSNVCRHVRRGDRLRRRRRQGYRLRKLRRRLLQCHIYRRYSATNFIGHAGILLPSTSILISASTQTTILVTAYNFAVNSAYKAIPQSFAKILSKHLTPTNSTLAMVCNIDRVLLVILPDYLRYGSIIDTTSLLQSTTPRCKA